VAFHWLAAFSFHLSRDFHTIFFPRSATNDRIIGKLTLAGLFNQLENLVGGAILAAASRKLRKGY